MMQVIIRKTLGAVYGSEAELEGLTDLEIVELCMEDTLELLDKAQWEVVR